ncbi:hypothetical protein HKD37_01G000027 [Glycine soja]
MAEEQKVPPPSNPTLSFDPSRTVGIIKRKALIKDLAAVYHAECLAYCQELLELQTKWEEPYIDLKTPEESKKETARPSKRVFRWLMHNSFREQNMHRQRIPFACCWCS